MANDIHSTAIIDPGAELGDGIVVGPYCVIGAGVKLGDGSRLHNHVTLAGPSEIGANNEFYPYASIGQRSQDLKYAGEPTFLKIGDGNTFREFCTVNRGTAPGSYTVVGSHGNYLAYSHIAHDCIVGNNAVFANAASLAGHVTVEDYVILGGFTLVHQFCQIGAHAFTSMGSVINRDVPPFVTVAGTYAEPRGINSEGLKRRGFDSARIQSIKRAYRTIYKSGLGLAEARSQLAEAATTAPDVKLMLDFIEGSQRSLVR